MYKRAKKYSLTDLKINGRLPSFSQCINRDVKKMDIDESQLHKVIQTLRKAVLYVQKSHKKEPAQRADFQKIFLSNLYPNKLLGGQQNQDITLPLGKDGPARAIIEFKDVANHNEMMSIYDLNKKALQEIVQYYLREVTGYEENSILGHHKEPNRNVTGIVTNGLQWFVIKRSSLNKYFNTPEIRQEFIDWCIGESAESPNGTNGLRRILSGYINNALAHKMPIYYFNAKRLIDSFNEPHLSKSKKYWQREQSVKFYKFFSTQNLMGEGLYQSPDKLTYQFYNELLYVMGLKEKSKNKGIERISKSEDKTRGDSLVDLIYRAIDNNPYVYKTPTFDDVLNMAMSFIDRMLFLKLLEGQLEVFNRDDKEHGKDFKFVTTNNIKDFSNIDELFFQVMARPYDQRNDTLKEKYSKVPYLNSSLFEPTKIEKKYQMAPKLLQISSKNLKLYKSSVLHKHEIYKHTKSLSVLTYIIDFLNCYKFRADSTSDNKYIINASILGSIFEKINGYKDGSYFTPTYVTGYMANKAIHQALINKMQQNHLPIYKLSDIDRYANTSSRAKEIKDILNDFHVVDPAVGSGHFLVSALNYLVYIYYRLNLLDANKLHNYSVGLSNNRLVIYSAFQNGVLQYRRGNKNLHDVQKEIFSIKEHIIENNLYGVDINPNSVNIAKLRLWIELLKSSYYKNNSDYSMVTMPNLEINIQTGNSILSQYRINDSLTGVSKDANISVTDLRNLSTEYKSTPDKDQKHKIRIKFQNIRSNIYHSLNFNAINKARQNYNNASQKYILDKGTQELIPDPKKKQKINDEKANVKHLKNILLKVEGNNNGDMFINSFEWRYRFPDLLDKHWHFKYFDAVITNPPYIQVKGHAKSFQLIKHSVLGKYSQGKMNLLYYFIYLALTIVQKHGIISMITTNYWLQDVDASKLRHTLKEYTTMLEIINLENLKIFGTAPGQHDLIFTAEKESDNKSNAMTKIINTNDKCKATQKKFQNLVSEKDTHAHYSHVKASKLYDNTKSHKVRITANIDPKMDKIFTNLISNTSDVVKNHAVCHKGIYGNPDKIFTLSKSKYNKLVPLLSKKEKSLIYPIISGKNIRDYYEHDINNKFIIYTTKYTNLKEIPHLLKYIKSSENKYVHKKYSKRKINSQGRDVSYSLLNKDMPYYALDRSGNKSLMSKKNVLFVPHLSANPCFMKNNKSYLVKSNSYYIFCKKNDKYLNSESLQIILNSTLCLFIWLYKHTTQGKAIKINNDALNDIPLVQKHFKDDKRIKSVLKIMYQNGFTKR